jgi:hypothetical protein
VQRMSNELARRQTELESIGMVCVAALLAG